MTASHHTQAQENASTPRSGSVVGPRILLFLLRGRVSNPLGLSLADSLEVMGGKAKHKSALLFNIQKTLDTGCIGPQF